MSPVAMHNGEVRYYSSPILVKSQQYVATLTSERLIIEGGLAPREFKVTNIVIAEPAIIGANEPGLKIILSTPNGQKEMVWGFPVGEVFKSGEQQAWIEHINEARGEKPFAVPASAPQTPRASPVAASTQAPRAPQYSPGEMEILQTAGVRIKRTYYTLYLTNLRLILQNANGQSGREFAIAELMDAAKMESESGEPSIALTVGSQTGVKQMILTFPSAGAREAWMTQISAKLPMHTPPYMAQQYPPGMVPPQQQMGGMQPPLTPPGSGTLSLQPGERTIISSPGLRVKRETYTAYLTNTRFVLMSNSYGALSIAGEFSINTLKKYSRMASELSEPGIALKMVSREGEKEMHLIFPSMDLRDMWLDKFAEVVPREQTFAAPPAAQYTSTTVSPPSNGNSQTKFCTVCGTRNHSDDRFCAMCGKPLDGGQSHTAAAAPDAYDSGYDRYDEEPRRQRKDTRSRPDRRQKTDPYGYDDEPRRTKGKKQRPPKRRKEPKSRKQYNGSILGFILSPSEAYSYYREESPKDALFTFILSGVIWAVVSVLLLAYVLPIVLNLNASEFPILGGLQGGDIMTIVMLIVMMLLLWMIVIIIQSVLVAIISKVFGEDAGIGEVMAVVMRSTLAYPILGWIPGFGIIISAFWSMFATMKGLEASLNMRGGSAIASAVIGLVIIGVLLIAVGLI